MVKMLKPCSRPAASVFTMYAAGEAIIYMYVGTKLVQLGDGSQARRPANILLSFLYLDVLKELLY